MIGDADICGITVIVVTTTRAERREQRVMATCSNSREQQ